MINVLLGKEQGLYLLDQADGKHLGRIKLHFSKARLKPEAQQHIEQLNYLGNSFIFRHFAPFCNDDIHSSILLEDFRSPVFRSSLTNRLPASFHKLLRLYDDNLDNPSLLDNLVVPTEVKKEAVSISNHTPFANTHDWFNSFDELVEQTSQRDFLVIMIAAIMKHHFSGKQHDKHEHLLFQMGVSNAYITMLLAEDKLCNPIRSFTMTLCHYISLLYIHRSLASQDSLPATHSLLEEINLQAAKISYWIAKDWGLPDEILVPLRERFQHPDDLSLMAEIMQKSEHATLALTLHQQGLLSRKQTQGFITMMKLEEIIDIDSINNTTH